MYYVSVLVYVKVSSSRIHLYFQCMHFGSLGVEGSFSFNHENLTIKCHLFTLCMVLLCSDCLHSKVSYLCSIQITNMYVKKDNFCLFLWGLSFHFKNFTSFGDVFSNGKGLLLTYFRHSWPWSSEGS